MLWRYLHLFNNSKSRFFQKIKKSFYRVTWMGLELRQNFFQSFFEKIWVTPWKIPWKIGVLKFSWTSALSRASDPWFTLHCADYFIEKTCFMIKLIKVWQKNVFFPIWHKPDIFLLFSLPLCIFCKTCSYWESQLNQDSCSISLMRHLGQRT